MRRLISPISSRKIVPPLATSSSPRRSRYAPVKLPLTWPKSADSSSESGMPAQLIVTSGVWARRLRWCTRRAITSFPTPLSPVMRTFASERAAYSISDSMARIAVPRPTSDSPRSDASRIIALNMGEAVTRDGGGDGRPRVESAGRLGAHDAAAADHCGVVAAADFRRERERHFDRREERHRLARPEEHAGATDVLRVPFAPLHVPGGAVSHRDLNRKSSGPLEQSGRGITLHRLQVTSSLFQDVCRVDASDKKRRRRSQAVRDAGSITD